MNYRPYIWMGEDEADAHVKAWEEHKLLMGNFRKILANCRLEPGKVIPVSDVAGTLRLADLTIPQLISQKSRDLPTSRWFFGEWS